MSIYLLYIPIMIIMMIKWGKVSPNSNTFPWKVDDRCSTNLYTEEELDYVQEKFARELQEHPKRCKNRELASKVQACSKVLHSCRPEEVNTNNMTGPFALAWYEIYYHQTNVVELWQKLYREKLSNRTLVYVGDSFLMEMYAAMMLTLRRGGADCPGGKRCSNGFTSYRPYVPHISKSYNNYLLESDIAIVNFGLHYNDMEVYDREMSVGIPQLAQFQRNHQKSKKIFWIDSSIPHFPAPDGTGSFVSYKRNASTSTPAKCRPITQLNDWRNNIADYYLTLSKHDLKTIKIRDIVLHRYDTHNGLLTHYTSDLLDCVHHCMQPCFWEPILLRVGEALLEAL